MKTMIAAIAFFFSLGTVLGQDYEDTIRKAALDYFDAYGNWDVDKMATFYKDSIHFIDPTALEAFQNNLDVVGKEKVSATLKGIFPGPPPKYIDFKTKEYFVSGTYVVVNSDFELILPKSWFGEKADGKIFVSIPAVTILRFEGDKIISHQDFVDYNSYNQQILLQLKTAK